MKKFLSVVLTIAMILSTVSVVAFAADVDVTTADELYSAVANATEGTVINIQNDINYTGVWTQVREKTGVTINGNGCSLTLSQPIYSNGNGDCLLYHSKVAVNDLTINFADGDKTSCGFSAFDGSAFSNVTINGGMVGIFNSGAVAMENCSFDGQSWIAIYSDDGGNTAGTTIKNCKFTDTKAYIVRSNEVITGNTISCVDNTAIELAMTVASSATATIKGNMFDEGTQLELYNSTSTISENQILGTVYAGSSDLSNTVMTDNVYSDDAKTTLNNSGLTVESAIAVAKVGAKEYYSLETAANEADIAGSNVVIDILADFTIDDGIQFTEATNVTINGNGHTITLENNPEDNNYSNPHEQSERPTGFSISNDTWNSEEVGSVFNINNITFINNKTLDYYDKGHSWRAAYHTYAYAETTNYTNVNFIGGVSVAQNASFVGCKFTENRSQMYMVFADQEYSDANESFEISFEDCEFNYQEGAYGTIKIASDEGDFAVDVKNSTFNNCANKPAINADNNITATLTNNTFNNCEKGAINADSGTVNGADVKNAAEVEKAVGSNNLTSEDAVYVADVEGVLYTSLEAAIAGAADGDTIDLMGNVHKLDNTNKIISGKEVTIQNGTFDISDTRWAGNSIFDVSGNSAVLNMNNVKFVGSNYGSSYGVIYVYSGATANLINVEFDLENELATGGAVLKGNGEQNSTFNIKDSTFKLVNPVSVIKNATLNMTGSKINAVINKNGTVNNAFREIEGSITDSEIYIEGFENGFKNIVDEELTIDGDSVVTVYNCSKGSPSEGKLGYDIDMTGTSVLTVAGDAKVYADTVNTGSNIEAPEGAFVSKANKIYLQFDYNEASKEGEKEYDIVLVGANSEDINRLNTADFTFDFDYTGTNGSKMAYEITPAEKITLTENSDFENRYMFNFKGKDNVEDTANSIVIGKVKFTGYGKFDFAVDTTVTYEDANIVTATTLVDNVVDVFSTEAGAEFVLSVNENNVVTDMVGKIEGVEIIVPTRALTINIDFPNVVESNGYDYQQMKVTVTGDDIETIEYKLGDTVAMNNGDYKIVVEDKLTLNNAYTVEVSGEGYRTARYTVTMTDKKELNFWNNVKDAAIEVEEGKASSAKNVTFLAGDIVKDSNINIYDLSAVVSYFGTVKIADKADAIKYIKYDLNRDGKIDSKDVAYVLVSWGK